jgi:cell division protein FtsB
MSVEGSEFMIMLLGWVMFLLTLQIAIWRDVVRQNLAEQRADDDMKYLRDKQAEWETEKRNMQDGLNVLTEHNQWLSKRLDNVRRAVSGSVK